MNPSPIVFTSAIDQTLSHVNRGFGAGATDYIFSPVDPEFLKFKVATYTQMFLRHEALRLQIERLEKLLRSLEAEIGQPDLRDRVRELDGALEELKRQAAV